MAKRLDACARELMETTPKIMQSIRVEMRRGRGTDLSIPQFRTLGFVQRHPDPSLSDLADHLGLTLPSTSKLVDGLVKQGLITRQECAQDRRRLTLALTAGGKALVTTARAGAQANLSKMLSSLADDELETVQRALEILRPLFVPQSKPSR